MSSECLAWAIRAKIARSSTKNLLMIVADLANHVTGEVFASLAYLEEATGLSKKTVIAGLQELESDEMRVLERTDRTVGRSGQIPVYIFAMSDLVPVIARGGKLHQSDRPVEKRPATGVKTTPGPVEKRHTEPRDSNLESEPIPPLPSEEDTPTGDLFGGEIEIAKPSIIEYVKERWAKLCDDFPRTHRVMAWTDSRKKAIAKRAAEIVAQSHGAFDAYQVWDMMFEAIRNDRWLRGQGEPNREYPTPFALDIDYILRPKVFTRTLEKAATNDRDTAATSDPHTGRQYGPTEQAARGALARFLAGGERSG
jgi:Helix-turn-helix domain